MSLNKKLIEKQINDLIVSFNNEIGELKCQLRELKEKEQQSWPEYGDTYYYINGVITASNTWDNHRVDTAQKAKSNIFKTEQDAELYLEISLRASELIGDWVPDWSDKQHSKYYIQWNSNTNTPYISSASFLRFQGTTHMSKEAAETLVKEYGYKLKIWITGGRG